MQTRTGKHGAVASAVAAVSSDTTSPRVAVASGVESDAGTDGALPGHVAISATTGLPSEHVATALSPPLASKVDASPFTKTIDESIVSPPSVVVSGKSSPT